MKRLLFAVTLLALLAPAQQAHALEPEPYVGEIYLWPGTFVPRGFMACEGQELDVAKFKTLFALLGTRYGGDGQTKFRLPDLRGAEQRLHKAMGLAAGAPGPRYIIAVIGAIPYRN